MLESRSCTRVTRKATLGMSFHVAERSAFCTRIVPPTDSNKDLNPKIMHSLHTNSLLTWQTKPRLLTTSMERPFGGSHQSYPRTRDTILLVEECAG